MSSLEDLTGINKIPTHFDSIDINENGQLALGASNLTGNFWNGVLTVFNDPSFAPNIPHVDYGCLNEAGCTHVEWIDNERVALSTDAGTVEVWKLKDTPSIENILTLSEHDDVCSSLSVSKQSQQIVSSSWDCCIKLWDLQVDLSINNVILHNDIVLDVKWNPTSPDVFASVSRDGNVVVYDNRREKPASVCKYTEKTHPTCLNWINETKLCIGYDNGDVSILDLQNTDVNVSFQMHKKTINDICYIPNLNQIVTASDDMNARRFDINHGDKESVCLTKHTDYVRSIAVHDDDVYSAGWDGQILNSKPIVNGEHKMES